MRLLRLQAPSGPPSEHIRHPLCLLKPGDKLLLPGCRDPEPVLPERPHLDRGAFDPKEGSCCAALPRLGFAIGMGLR